MPDREKVIKGLNDISGFITERVGAPFIAGRIGIDQAVIFLQTIDDAIALLKQEVVRCIDCKYGSWWSDEHVTVCDKLSKTRDKNWFCADGEKRE